jgi:hypothetical protein
MCLSSSAELVDAEDGDDVLEVLVALEDLLDAGCATAVVPLAEDRRDRGCGEVEARGSTAG